MVTQTRTATGFTAVVGAWTPSAGTRLSAVQTSGDGVYVTGETANDEFYVTFSAFTVPTGQAHWHVLLRARAIETGSFVLAAAQGGMHEGGKATYGHSLIINPWGEILAEAGTEPCVIAADIDVAASAAARGRIPALKNARDFTLKRL